MARVAALIENLFEDSEFHQPAEAFRQAGHQLTVVGLEVGKVVKGKKEGTTVKVEKAVKDVRVEDFDALLIPGGYAPDLLRRDDVAVAFAREFVEAGKPTFIICHSAQLLVTARVLKGRRATGHKAVLVDIENAGAEFVDAEVVVDGNLVSSRTPADMPAFIRECLKLLG
ncbi:MAG TPA: type 1 glutamine amidotransferase domain-containing protein [Candidatus Glassbacteria bacterium]|nr:type 1 glutamine amidotransferase domain-containing protein [Candidatus Glassbacteria bacterium]